MRNLFIFFLGCYFEVSALGTEKPTIMIVEDAEINRKILCHILGNEYNIIEAENGQEALTLLDDSDDVAAVLLDIVMPVMDGYEFLNLTRTSRFSTLPIIAVTAEKDQETERKILQLGAWDFVSKPYQPEVLKLRLNNVIIRSRYFLLTQMQHAFEYDSLTGLFNRNKFFDETAKMIRKYPNTRFAIIRFDIDRFHVLNSFWGEEEGDRFLCKIAVAVTELGEAAKPSTYARINADTFCLCEPYDDDRIRRQVEWACLKLEEYNRNFSIKPSVGVYVIEDRNLTIQTMLEMATLAAKECKGKYKVYARTYEPSMSIKTKEDQEILGEMHTALERGDFCVYLQPKFDLKSERPCGAEALIRWKHPEKGMLSPGKFIPLFENNGFIDKIDYFVWESVCKLLRKWIDRGLNPAPISVNVSRVNMYNPHFVAIVKELVKKYDISPSLLNLELTESAYMEDPIVMTRNVTELREAGFVILMDDFGSGYSSLNAFKDIPIDVLKIDMQFIRGDISDGKKECIMTSVVHMASWLKMPVIVEGVETRQQVDFLKSIGCNYVQGYYYSRPIPVEEYEKLGVGCCCGKIDNSNTKKEGTIFGTTWSDNPYSELLFESMMMPALICEYVNGAIRPVRVNSHFRNFFGYESTNMDWNSKEFLKYVPEDSMKSIRNVFEAVSCSCGSGECEFVLIDTQGDLRKVKLKVKFWGMMGEINVMFVTFSNG